MDRVSGVSDLLRLAVCSRRFDRRFVAARYYRPTGFVWKQAFKKSRREPAITKLALLNLAELSLLDQVSILGLRYRIAILSGADQGAIRELDIKQVVRAVKGEPDLLFDLMMLQHVTEDWVGLEKSATSILVGGADDKNLTDLAADMLVQATYQQIASKIFKNTISVDDVAGLRAAITMTETALGANHGKLNHYRGLLASVSGDLEKATAFHVAANANTGYSTQFFRAAANIISIEQVKTFAEKPLHALPKNCWKLRHTGFQQCTLVSADQGYFSQYFEGFLESFSLLNPGALLHLHAVGFEPKAARIIDLESRFGVPINITADPQSMSSLSPDLFKGYCAGARYMYLPQYLALYDRIIIHDIDGVLETSMASVWEGRQGTIMISSLVPNDDRKGHFAFWSNIGAGAFAIAANSENLKFGKVLSGYLHSRFDVCQQTGGRFFFTDQIGLLLATLALKDECTLVRMPAIFKQSGDTRGQQRERVKKEAQEQLLKKLRNSEAQ